MAVNASLPLDWSQPYTVILPEDVSYVTMTALQQLLEEGSCQVHGETGKREVIQLKVPLQCSSVVGRTMSSHNKPRIKETWIVGQ